MKTRFAAIIPCAGYSSRMGRFKPLLRLGNLPNISRVIETVKTANPVAVHVVVGHRAHELENVIADSEAKIIINPDYDLGMYSSIMAGVKDLASICDAFLLLPADIPLVRPATIERLTQAADQHPGKILYPVISGKRGHPPVIPADLIPAILKFNGEGGLRAFLCIYENRALDVPTADENILFDMDTPGDYEEAIDRCAHLHVPSAIECEAVFSCIGEVSGDIVRHGSKVREIALRICRALNNAGACLDEDVVAAAAFLHDIAKGLPDHAAAGGEMVKSLGFRRVGEIMTHHMDLPRNERRIGEAAVVYLADKMTVKEHFVSIELRFESALNRFGHDPEARESILKRKAVAEFVKKMMEARLGHPMESLFNGMMNAQPENVS